MKKSLTGMLALLAGATVTYGQGAVSLANYGALGTYLYVSYKATGGTTTLLGGAGNGDPTPSLSNYAMEVNNGADWTVALYGAVGASLPTNSLSPLAGETSLFANGLTGGHGNDATIGTWSSQAVFTLSPSTSPVTMTLQLVAWYSGGSGMNLTLAQAMADGVPVGYSSPANVSLNFPPNSPAAIPENLGNFTVQAVPEPSTIALGVIGASTFLMRLRRKK